MEMRFPKLDVGLMMLGLGVKTLVSLFVALPLAAAYAKLVAPLESFSQFMAVTCMIACFGWCFLTSYIAAAREAWLVPNGYDMAVLFGVAGWLTATL